MILVCEILRKFDIDNLYICPSYLYTVTTLPWEVQKSHFFQQYYSQRLQIITLSQKKQTATVVLQLICLLTVVYYFLLSAQPYSMVSFLSLWSVLFKATNANPQPALFRVTNIWRNAKLSAVRCKFLHFTRQCGDIFLVWWVRG